MGELTGYVMSQMEEQRQRAEQNQKIVDALINYYNLNKGENRYDEGLSARLAINLEHIVRVATGKDIKSL